MTSEPKKTGREKRRRVTNYDASDVEGYTGLILKHLFQIAINFLRSLGKIC